MHDHPVGVLMLKGKFIFYKNTLPKSILRMLYSNFSWKFFSKVYTNSCKFG